MKVGEMKRELESYGIVGSSHIIEKTDLVEALQKARLSSRFSARHREQQHQQQTRGTDGYSSGYVRSSRKISTSTNNSDDNNNNNNNNMSSDSVAKMSIKELKKELESVHAISTKPFLEKSDLIAALVEAKARPSTKKQKKAATATQAPGQAASQAAASTRHPLEGKIYSSLCSTTVTECVI